MKVVRGDWDTSKSDDKILTSTGGHQEVWFEEAAATKYTITVTVSNVKAVNDDWPSVGILVGDDLNGHGIRVSLFSGWRGTGAEHWFKTYDLNFAEPPLVPETILPGTSGIETADGVELKVVRDGTKYWFYIDGELMYSGESSKLATAGFAGFYSNGCSAVFSNYSYEINE